MENATKALLISGGVLIAIIILTVLVKTYSKIGMFQKQQLSKEEAEQIEEFNKDYTKYAGQYVYGTEVITIINKTVDYNKRTGKNITVNIKFNICTFLISNNAFNIASILLTVFSTRLPLGISLINVEKKFASIFAVNPFNVLANLKTENF